MWVSPQRLQPDWLDEFFGILKHGAGVADGHRLRPAGAGLAVRSCAKLSRSAIRSATIPDITHSRQCQYPVPDWDAGLRGHRSARDDQPAARSTMTPHLPPVSAPHTIGFLTYSEGCNDDVNKMVWSGLGWDPAAQPIEMLREYGRYFIGRRARR